MLSSLAPFVVPLMPGYLSFLAGTSLAMAPVAPDQSADNSALRRRPLG